MTALHSYALFLHLVHLCRWSFCTLPVHVQSNTWIKSTSRWPSKQKQKILLYISGFAHIWHLWSNSWNMPFTLLPRGRMRKEEGITEKRERGREGSAQDKQLMQSQSTLICVRPNHRILAFWLTLRTAKGQTRAHVSITVSHRGINKWVNGVGICKCGQKERETEDEKGKRTNGVRERGRETTLLPFYKGNAKTAEQYVFNHCLSYRIGDLSCLLCPYFKQLLSHLILFFIFN